jgi:RNA-directed DNA polymerase
MNASLQVAYEWKDLPWKKFQKQTFKLQKRIYRASLQGNMKLVRSLQKLLIKSQAAAHLAVRRVSQDNQGKKTAGVDGVKKLTPPQRTKLTQEIKVKPYIKKAKAVRRVWIPKANKKDEKRPLGIPTMEERARQALIKLALEPEWEAKFEPNSYGFRPGRSAQDAISYIFSSIRECPKYVLDTDIAKCFDKINHKMLLEKLHTYPQMERTIKAWLKAGILDGKELFPSEEGTPQGRVHWQPQIIRYADDAVILHPDPGVIEQSKVLLEQWLKPLGLELKKEQTRISHTYWYGNETPGFDFLGFNIRQYKVGKTHRPISKYYRLDYTTIIKPSSKALKNQSQKLNSTIKSLRANTQEELIRTLNPIIGGWGRYFGICASKSKGNLDHRMLYFVLKRWARRRHPKKNWGWVARKYWRLETGKWTFATPNGLRLQSHYQKIERLLPIGKRSPYDGDWAYWLMRTKQHPDLNPTKAKLFRRQKGKCTYCGLHFQVGDVIEMDHVIPKERGGLHVYLNLQLLHRHCHDSKTLQDKSNDRGIFVKD